MTEPIKRDYGPTGCCQEIGCLLVACTALLLGGVGWALVAAARWVL